MSDPTALAAADPPRDCPLCPRLVEYREALRVSTPDGFNAPVPTFWPADEAKLLIVGLAPGVSGANHTGRPFTGDFAGDVLYNALIAHGFADGVFRARPDDGLALRGAAVTNAVRCVPPKNKPTGPEINTCRPFLARTVEEMTGTRVILALGRIAHDAVLRTLGLKLSAYPFGHGAVHRPGGVVVADSYHPSRYNVNTRVLTPAMFDAIIANVRRLVDTV